MSRARPSARVVNGSPEVSPDVVDGGERGHRRSSTTCRTARPARWPAADPSAIALIVPEDTTRFFGDPFFAAIVQGITASARRERLRAQPARRDRPIPVDKTVRYLRSRRGRRGPRHLAPHGRRPASTERRHAAPARLRRPPVASRATTIFVDVDNVEGGAIGTQHLIDVGRHAHRHDRPDRSTCPRASTASRATVDAHGRGRPGRRCRSRPRDFTAAGARRRDAAPARPGARPRRASSSRATSWRPGCSRCCASAVDRCPTTSRSSASTTARPRPRRRSR